MKIPTTRRYSRRSFSILLGAAPVLAAGMQASAQIPEVSAAPPSDETDARELAIEAYIYAYPLVTMEYTRRVMTNTVKPEGTHAPMGQFANLREYPTAAFKEVTAPNADTLYSGLARFVAGAGDPACGLMGTAATTSCQCSTPGLTS